MWRFKRGIYATLFAQDSPLTRFHTFNCLKRPKQLKCERGAKSVPAGRYEDLCAILTNRSKSASEIKTLESKCGTR